MNADPPVRADGRCSVCKKSRQPERSKRYAGIVAETDPFCSVDCARVFHGQPSVRELRKTKFGREITPQTGKAGGTVHGTRQSYRMCACPLCSAAVQA